jgi:dTDP-4-dehydrorhamnose 3,5-epimerase
MKSSAKPGGSEGIELNISRCQLEGLLLVEPKVFGDSRGFFMESWNQRRYEEAGLTAQFVQDNFSFSHRGALRGLHFQNPNSQGKLVSVLQGEVFDVVVDLRRHSPTFGRHEAVRLSGDNKRQFYIPPGFAHGFLVLSETALFHYKCTTFYSPKDEMTLLWNDPEIGIEWPLPNPTLSEKDGQGQRLRDLPVDRLF